MLQNIGDKLKGNSTEGGRGHRWVWYTIIDALILVFVMWGPYSMFDHDGQRCALCAPRVNGEEIPAEEINREWQQQQPRLLQAFGGQISDLQRDIYQQQLLDSAVRGLAVTQHARKLGYGSHGRAVVGPFAERGSLPGRRQVQPAGRARAPSPPSA